MKLKDLTILVTGGAGFIGTKLIERLYKDNFIIVYDNLRRNSIKYSGLLEHKNVELIVADVRDRKKLEDCFKKYPIDVIVHLASIAGVDTVLKDPVLTMEVSLIGTINILQLAYKYKDRIKRVVDFSTSEVFGKYAYRVSEGDVTALGAVGEARWTYAVSKLATEHLAYNYYKMYGLPTVSVRPFNIFGPGQVGEGAIHNFIVRAIKNEPLIIHNDGDQIRAWCYIDDLIDGLILCLEKETAIGNAFNIGNPRSTITIYNLAKLIIRLCNSSSALKFVKIDQADVELRVPDITKAKRLLGFSPKIDLEEGLIRTIKWYRERLKDDDKS